MISRIEAAVAMVVNCSNDGISLRSSKCLPPFDWNFLPLSGL